MLFEKHLDKIKPFENLELLAHQIVEGFISGMHKSPFHGFSAEFAEHKIYNTGESTKHIDWKLFAKTDRLYTKRYEEETNLRCHFILDNSSSMHFPILTKDEPFYHSKIGFSVLAIASLMNLLKKQRDAVGLSVFSNEYEYYAPDKGSERHHRMLLSKLEEVQLQVEKSKTTDTVQYLHQIAEKLNRRSMVVLFTDMFQHDDEQKLLGALQHLKHNKHKVVLFHTYDSKRELNFDYDQTPRKFIDLETGEEIKIFANSTKDDYQKMMIDFFKSIKLACSKNAIQYIPVDVQEGFEKILTIYLAERQKFV
jgi:uncharacterized protein (DUF58 family)